MPSQFRVAPLGRAKLNESFEGMTLADERTLIASMEGPLMGDHEGIVRFQSWERSDAGDDFKPGAQYAYRLEPGLLVSDIAATGDGRLLLIERGFDNTGNQVRLNLADLRDAPDVSAIEHLDGDTPVVGKQLVIDMVDLPSSGALARQPQKNPLLGNIEAMVITERDANGELRVLLATDDNGSEKQITRMYWLGFRLP